MKTTIIVRGEFLSSNIVSWKLKIAKSGGDYSRLLFVGSEKAKYSTGKQVSDYEEIYFNCKKDAYSALQYLYRSLKEQGAVRWLTSSKRILQVDFKGAKAYIQE